MFVTAKHVADLELYAQEGLMDLNGWMSNPSTVMGFAYGRNHPVAKKMQENIDEYGRHAEQIDEGLFESHDEYCEFIADLCNTIQQYNYRFTLCWDEAKTLVESPK